MHTVKSAINCWALPMLFITLASLGGCKLFNNDGSSSSDPATGTLTLPTMSQSQYFIGNNGTNGYELWTTDGTDAGTLMVKDINPAGDSYPDSFVEFNGVTYFTANDGSGYSLWKTDGTGNGTEMVTVLSGYAYNFINFNGVLYFTAYDSTWNDSELWTSDGTAAGTEMVKDINPGTGSSDPNNLTVFDGALYFSANDGTNGTELWTSDGTAVGTVMLKDINPGAGSSNPYSYSLKGKRSNQFFLFNGALYFQADDATNGYELWKSDGTAAGTVRMKDINPDAGSSSPGYFVIINGALYFSADNGTNGAELWTSDGTDAGTAMVKDINPGAGSGVNSRH